MPIYEYRCQACGFEKEVLQKLSDPPLSDCPSCGKAAMSKLVSAAGFQLKGTGWYATDFKNSGSKPAKTDGAAPGEAAAPAKSDAQGESKAGEGKAGESKGGESKAGESKAQAAGSCGAGACPACQ